MKDDFVYLRHIMECIRRIELNTACGRGHSAPSAGDAASASGTLRTTTFDPATFMTSTGRCGSTNSPSATTETRLPSIRTVPDGLRGESETPL